MATFLKLFAMSLWLAIQPPAPMMPVAIQAAATTTSITWGMTGYGDQTEIEWYIRLAFQPTAPIRHLPTVFWPNNYLTYEIVDDLLPGTEYSIFMRSYNRHTGQFSRWGASWGRTLDE